MCGRFAMNKETDDLIQEYVARGGDFRDWRPSYNVTPTTVVPVIRQRDGVREIAGVRWGIVPPSSPTFGGGKPIINARVETVASNGLFSSAFASHRCIVPALGYYEWQVTPDGKQPYFVHRPGGGDMMMAGIIRPWLDRSLPKDDPARWHLSMAIVTRDAHVAPGEVHDRMPSFLTPESVDDWLGDHLSVDNALRMLELTSLEVANDLDFYAVSRQVNSVRNDGPQLIEAV
ncbi:SOS response-associated peptidase [Salinibacterium hongtaonis]|uniref:SOS response-associated peptidase n=1 Tax=Homoserinimonas hongtaonis TaxID=2079791 RepID=UPI000D36E452|nr:SOS response-associated peptidase [Salinibacterium hongtaonis]AWB89785.1 SOS response-associated peptidase [Salinibacterium hongtaonis]